MKIKHAQRKPLRLARVAIGLMCAPLWLGAEGGPPNAGSYRNYAVAADHPEASKAGAEVLSQGGTAADAAAATMLALGVVSPQSSGLGGGGFALYYRKADRSLTFLDFRETAPLAAKPGMFDGDDSRGSGPLSEPSQLGGLATGVPGEPAGIEALLGRFGSLPRKAVTEPAIRLADEGFIVSAYTASLSMPFSEQMRRDPEMARWFEDGEIALRAGQRLRRPELARTLREFAKHGARPFYRGALARTIVQSNRARGGVLTLRDLFAYEVVERTPLEARRLGYRWVSAPPPSAGGYTILQSLAFVEQRLATPLRRETPLWWHLLAESWKGPYQDRAHYFGDPAFADVPLEALNSPSRMAERSRGFHPTLAMPAADFFLPLHSEKTEQGVARDSTGTSHLCVVDADGNVASVTTTINLPFGARYTAGGMVMNDEMDDFGRPSGDANAFALGGGLANLPGPERRPVSSMSPTIVFDEEGPVLCIGGSGGSRIITATEQVALNTLLFGMTLEKAVSAPRIHHQGTPNLLYTEAVRPIDPEILAKLVARGHRHEILGNIAVVQGIHIRRTEDGRSLQAASDPYKGGAPAGR